MEGTEEELAKLVEQLDELLAEQPGDDEDAADLAGEVAAIAGLLHRMKPDHPALVEAVAWRDTRGSDALNQAFIELDVDEIIDELEGVLTGEADEEAIENAVYEVDEWIAGAVWTNRRAAVKGLAKRAAATIRQIPDPFAFLSDEGSRMARQAAIAADLDLYDFWLAIADSKEYR